MSNIIKLTPKKQKTISEICAEFEAELEKLDKRFNVSLKKYKIYKWHCENDLKLIK